MEGDKIIYNDDPLIYVIEDFITEEECKHFVAASDFKLEELKQSAAKMVFIMKIELAVIVVAT